VPPPPVSGAVTGYTGAGACFTGATPCLAGADDAEAEADADADADACGELEALRCAVGDVLAPAFPVDEAPPAGDGVRLLDTEACPLAGAVGVKIDGTEEPEPPPVQAETAITMSTAPAAERPAISHAPGAALGLVRRIFMNPPRMRVR
jgi:hypothetical protein